MVSEARPQPFPLLRHRPSWTAVGGLSLVALLLVWLAINLAKAPADFMNIFLIGLTTGAIYALIALGYTLVYGVLVIAMAFCGTLNASIELVAYRPLRGAPRLAPLITAIGMSFILQNVGLIWKGPNY